MSASPHDALDERQAAHSAAALRELPEALILVFDDELRFVLSAGQALARSERFSATFRAGQPIADAFPADLWRLMEPLCRSALHGETRSRELWSTDARHGLMVDIGPLRANGPAVRALGAASSPQGGLVTGGVAVVLDVSARRRAEDGGLAARHPHEHLAQVFDHAPIGMGLLDQDGRWVLVNHALCDITGYTAAELIGSRFHDVAHPKDADNDVAQRRQLLYGEIAAYETEKRYFNAAGESMSALLAISLVRDRDGAPLHFIVQLQDISERKRLEERLRHLADHDPLTGLRNRRLFEADLELQVGRCQRYGESAALLVIDLDGFKAVNDRHGHGVGDDALRALARTLTRRLRATDLLARLGGDEFAVLLPHIDAPSAQRVVADLTRVIATCTVDAGDTVLHLSGSIGFTLIDREARDDEQILAEADRAMYAAKRAKALGAQVP
ncbi:MAG TPA: diguanylate cyclase [Solirubrobacteraceae bacterium]|jgi:diguanylate cyclase (GGDEF)-like protein/PAS domain S-box-containing protein|nr:diguanylate cyclase [Solirubrobacteraceae bacterium]